MKRILALTIVLAPMLCVMTGCADDNPVSPEKMQVIRKKQSDEMQQLAKGGAMPTKPPTR